MEQRARVYLAEDSKTPKSAISVYAGQKLARQKETVSLPSVLRVGTCQIDIKLERVRKDSRSSPKGETTRNKL